MIIEVKKWMRWVVHIFLYILSKLRLVKAWKIRRNPITGYYVIARFVSNQWLPSIYVPESESRPALILLNFILDEHSWWREEAMFSESYFLSSKAKELFIEIASLANEDPDGFSKAFADCKVFTRKSPSLKALENYVRVRWLLRVLKPDDLEGHVHASLG